MKKKTTIIKHIISGGQSGVDRSALDFSIKHNVPHSGWCPKERWAEDGQLPPIYNLKQTESKDPGERTLKNVLEADGTLVIYQIKPDHGTQLTIEYCKKHDKTFIRMDLQEKINGPAFKNWLQKNNIEKLNIAGPRESNSPGIYNKCQQIFKDLFFD